MPRTTLYDLVKDYLDGLQQIENFTTSTINDCQQYDTTFKNRRDGLLNYDVSFSGLGSIAFSSSVDLNLLRSQQLLGKLYDVWEPSNHTRQAIQALTSNSDMDLQIPNVNATTTPQECLGTYDMTPLDVQLRLRDESLHGLKADDVLNLYSDAFSLALATAQKDVISDIQKKHDQTIDVYNQSPDPLDMQQQIELENQNFEGAKAGVAQIAQFISVTYEDWRQQFQSLTASYIGSVTSVGTNLDTVTTGDILHQLDKSGAAMMIQTTADGGLIVAINNSDKLTPQQVEAAIQQYIQNNGLQPPVHVTIVGYQHGADIGLQVGADVAANPNQYGFQINNEVLIAPTNLDAVNVTQQPNTEYDVYSFSRDMADSGGWGPIFQPDAVGLSTNFATGVSGSNAISAVISYMTGVGENAANRQDNAYVSQLQAMDPNHYYSVNTKSEDYIHLLPDEWGAHSPSIFSSANYDQSTYLNNVGVPDPVITSQKIPQSNVGRTPVTSTYGKSTDPVIGTPNSNTNSSIALVSAPTYYYT